MINTIPSTIMLDEDAYIICRHCCLKIRRNGWVVACYVCRGIFHLKCIWLSLKDFKHLKSDRTWNCCSCADNREFTIRQGIAPRRQTWQRVDWIEYFVFRTNFDCYERAHAGADVFGGNITTTHKLLLLSRFI